MRPDRWEVFPHANNRPALLDKLSRLACVTGDIGGMPVKAVTIEVDCHAPGFADDVATERTAVPESAQYDRCLSRWDARCNELVAQPDLLDASSP